jgi:hypothetical protein
MKFSSIKKRVYDVLWKVPESRDSDKALIFLIWRREAEAILHKRIDSMTGREVFLLLVQGKLSSSETIRRNRQLLEKLHPNLRGRTYNYRHNISEPESINDIKLNYNE